MCHHVSNGGARCVAAIWPRRPPSSYGSILFLREGRPLIIPFRRPLTSNPSLSGADPRGYTPYASFSLLVTSTFDTSLSFALDKFQHRFCIYSFILFHDKLRYYKLFATIIYLFKVSIQGSFYIRYI